VNACTDGNPERNENANQADQAKGNATRLQANLQHSCYEGVDSEKLVSCISAGSRTQRQETHEGDQADSEFTNLFDEALCHAIGPRRDDPVVSPPNIEDTTNCLQNVEYEKRELS
jgi:hypothetical protein